MEKLRLLEVHGYYNETDSFEFTEEKSWTGHAILREDLTFEGIVIDSINLKKDKLISGTLVEYNGASLMKFSNGGLCPFSFYGMSTGKEILGSYSVHDYLFTNVMGRCKLVFTEVPLTEDIINDIESRIDSFKENMDDFSKELYVSLIDNISFTVNNFIVNMEISKLDIEAEIGASLAPLELNED